MRESPDPAVVLRRGLEDLSIRDPDRAHAVLEKYLDELERWNPRFGLVKYADRRELVVKHVLDSLAGVKAVREALEKAGVSSARPAGASVLDVGSGAGFPGIPLAAAMPSVSFTLLERMARRVSFLKTCAVLLGLPRLRVVQADVCDADGDYDVVTFRAVAPLEKFLQEIGKSRIHWRIIIAWKGREDRAREEVEEARSAGRGGMEFQVVSLDPPFLEEERCLIIASSTPLLTNG
jgi:16S rRNA (guanine527-N7)-methyltransferase